MKPPVQRICLNMIVKNEAPVIRRCLDSVKPLIHAWVIVDTGSTDGTEDIVRECLRDIPGEIHERPWVDFAHNRSEALALARGRGDYVLVIDADEVIEIETGFAMPRLAEDSCNVQVRYGGYTYLRRQLVKNTLPWRYEGVLHEYMTCDQARTERILPGLVTVPHHDGARSRDPLTYRRDALMLEKALLEDPGNARYVFYLAQSYRDAGDWEMALRHYKRRAEMSGWTEESWFSLYQIAQGKEKLDVPWMEAMEAYLAAWQYKPDRAGPLFRIAMHYQAKGEYNLSHMFLARAMQMPPPTGNRLFVEHTIYDYQLPLEYAVACYYVGDHAGAISTNNRLLQSGKLPPYAVEQVVKNRRFSLDVLFPKPSRPEPPSGRLLVVIPFRDPGPELDDCMESLRLQDHREFQAHLLDLGSVQDQTSRVPSEDVRFSLHRVAASVEEWVLQHARAADIVFQLTPSNRLAGPEILAQVRAAFEDSNCFLAYAQYRRSNGSMGAAEPASSVEDFNLRGAALPDRSPVAFRPALLGEGKADIFHGAGYARTRFSDAAWTETVEATPFIRPAAQAPIAGAPLVSCVMITLDRLALAKRAILSYAGQTYANRELVIVTDGTERFRAALERFVNAVGAPRVRVIPVGSERLTLGRLRNISLDEAAGEVVCQWDDDDCSHPERLTIQVGEMLRRQAGASFLTDHLQYIEDHRLLCWVDWTLGGAQGKDQLAPGTIMLFKDARFRYPEEGPLARQGEDSVLLDRIYSAVPVAHLTGFGYLYLYHYHGRNTFSREHHYRLSNFRTSTSHLREHEAELKKAMIYYPVPRPVVVVGKEGPAFAID